ncbi:MAG: nucleotidyltransferase domain-containing protein [Candidatus Freyarchaeota archaeon]|nr:nucleotidyltransferase domain-containing protein [Candidatus Jordarchaeia archaeon]
MYFRLAPEYYDAKRRAARNLRAHVLPTNREVALELDKLASLLEGERRVEKLKELREDALEVMVMLEQFSPVLVGSVWRGTARIGSDIDIRVFADEPQDVIKELNSKEVDVNMELSGKDRLKRYVHLHFKTRRGNSVEVVVRPLEEKYLKETCDIFGDEVKGLTIPELKKVLREDPVRRFVPE